MPLHALPYRRLAAVVSVALAGLVAAMLLAGTAGAVGAEPPGTPAGTQAVYQTPTSGTFINSSGQVVGGWAELAAPTVLTAAAQSEVSPLTTKTEDGGTWEYGDYVSGSSKYCYSDYVNDTKTHSATVEMNPAPNNKDTEDPRIWAEALNSAYANVAGICYAYWSD